MSICLKSKIFSRCLLKAIDNLQQRVWVWGPGLGAGGGRDVQKYVQLAQYTLFSVGYWALDLADSWTWLAGPQFWLAGPQAWLDDPNAWQNGSQAWLHRSWAWPDGSWTWPVGSQTCPVGSQACPVGYQAWLGGS